MDPRLVLTVMSAAAELFALSRLVSARVHRSYPVFVIYLIAGFLQSFAWLAGSPDSHAYLRAYRWTTPFILALQYLIVLEVWRRLMSCYSGIHRISKAFGVAILAIAVSLAFSTGFDGLTMWGHPIGPIAYHWLMWAARYSASMLCIAAGLLALWANLFDHGVPSNLIRHAEILTAYFGSVAAGYLVINLAPGTAPWVGACMTGAAAAFYVTWGLVLTPKGEQPIERLLAYRWQFLKTLPPPVRRFLPY